MSPKNKKIYILLVLSIKEINLWPELSSPPRFSFECSFESRYGESIKENVVDYLNHSNELARHEKKSLHHDYNDDWNYVGDDPKLMDSDDELETDNEN